MTKINKRTINIILFIMFILSLAALGYTARKLGNITAQFVLSAVISFMVLGLIVFLYKRWLKNFYRPLKDVTDDLRNFKKRFDGLDEDEGTSVSVLMGHRDELFNSDYLRGCLNRYLDELERLEADDAECFRCDISEYINYDDICEHVKKGYAENIASSMTGIGLLGTFIGLAVGLQSFDASSMGSMESSISPLIDGIKTAFYTSIYGVVVSLLLSHCLKENTHDLDLALEEFYEEFYEDILAYPEYLLQKQALEIQQDQRDIMANFAETMAVSLSREMNQLMVPLFEKMSNTIDAFSENVANSQADGLGRIVDGFVDNMNTSLGNQFENLSNVIRETCEWQQAATESMDRVVDAIKEEAQDIAAIDIKLKETITKFDEYLEKLVEQEQSLSAQMEVYKNTLDITMQSLENSQNNINSMLEQQSALIEVEKTYNRVMEESVLAVKNTNQEMIEGVEKVTEIANDFMKEITAFSNHEIERIEDRMSAAGTKMNSAAERLSTEYDKLRSDIDNTLSRTFKQFDEELANITGYVGSALNEVNDNTEKIPLVVNSIFETLKEETEDYILKVTDINKSLENAAGEMSQASKQIASQVSFIGRRAGE